MAVPNWQGFLLPVLQVLSDGHERRMVDVSNLLAEYLHLTDEDRNEVFSLSGVTKLRKRSRWAMENLIGAGLLEKTGPGRLHISHNGIELLETKPSLMDEEFLKRYPDYMTYLGKPSKNEPSLTKIQGQGGYEHKQSPDDMMESGYQALKQALAQELLERVRNVNPTFFETLVLELLVAMGYSGSPEEPRAKRTGGSGDGGIDGIISEDKLGLSSIYIQAKRWGNAVNDEVVRTFDGSMNQHGAKKGVLITTATFTEKAKRSASSIHDKKIVLIDGTRLAELMIEYNVGVAVETTYVVKKLNVDYFDEA